MEKVARSITARSERVTFNNVRVNCLGYVDDINIIGVNLREVENLTTQLKTMACQVGLEMNEGKTKIMEVARTPQLQGSVDLAGIGIETTETFKYLGTIMSQNAGMAEEVTGRIGAATRCYFSLTDLFKRRSISRHMARTDEDRAPKRIFLTEVAGRRPVGRPRKDWRRCLEEDVGISGGNPNEWFHQAQDREEWRILSRAVMGQNVA
ncbi:uncharacterized protein [Palaemon carinicauda]|uniref:uncharacterized protein n=1 Tax=Palaemon carinicauda TaxID=392227 RepID=UPI0035B65FB1